MSTVGVIVLAAGRSTRFSGGRAHKLLAQIGTASVIRHSVLAAVAAAVGDVLVVTGAESDAVSRELDGLPVRIVNEPAFSNGMATSLKRGLETIRTSVDAILIALGDQPSVQPDAYRQVVARWHESGAAIVVPRYVGAPGPAHPTLFGASTFDELLALSGDVGARAVIGRDPVRVEEVTLDWPAPRDIDTFADLEIVSAQLLGTSVTENQQGREPNVKRIE